MQCLFVFLCVSTVSFLCVKSNRAKDGVSLETELESLRYLILMNSQRLRDLEKQKPEIRYEAAVDNVSEDVEKRLKNMETDIREFKGHVSDSLKRIAKGLADQKIEDGQATVELRKDIESQREDIKSDKEKLEHLKNTQKNLKMSLLREVDERILEALESVNSTVSDFRHDLLQRKDFVKEEKIKTRQITNLRKTQIAHADHINAIIERLNSFLSMYNSKKDSISSKLGEVSKESKEEKAASEKSKWLTRQRPISPVINVSPRQSSTTTTTVEPEQKVTVDEKTTIALPQLEPGCRFPWFKVKDRCYQYMRYRRKTWYEASRDCRIHGGFLAEPHTADVYDKVADKTNMYSNGVWLGGTKISGDWAWHTTKQPIAFDRWYSGEPEPWNVPGNCLFMRNKKLFGTRCSWKIPYLCEKKARFMLLA